MKRGLSDDELITAWGHVVEGYAIIGRAMVGDMEDTSGLPGTWFEVLLRLSRSPEHRLPMSALAAQVSFSSGGFTKLADRMEEAGLVERKACPEDRRVTWITPSRKGASKIAVAKAAHVEFLRRHVLHRLGADGMRELGELMRTLRDAEIAAIASAPPAH